MGRIITAVAVGVAVMATGVSVKLYADLHPNPAVTVKAEIKKILPPKEPHQPTAEDAAKDAAAEATIRAAQDADLTGDVNGRAEWKAPDGADLPTICGVTPEGRYFVKRNRYGQARYDEPPPGHGSDFSNAWGNIGCEKTSPVNQRYLIHDQNVEEHYNFTHPVQSDKCLFAEMRASVANKEGGMGRDPHYCQDGQYERDQAAKAKSPDPSVAETAEKPQEPR